MFEGSGRGGHLLPRAVKGLVLAVALVLLSAAGASAATFTVNTTADNAPNGSECSGAAGDCGLRQAIDKANTAGGANTVVVPAGHYTLTISGTDEDNDQTGDLDVTTGTLTLTGAGARSTTIDAGGIDRVLNIQGGATANVSGFTITGGNDTVGSGGGGIANWGTLHLDASTVTGNTTTDVGGGIYEDSNVPDGTTSLTVTHSTISNNTSSYYGGGMDFDGGDATISDTTIVGNVSQYGGHGDSGGAMEIDDGNLVFQNDTIANNRATDTSGNTSTSTLDAGGVELYGDASSTHPVFENTIIANNQPTDCHVRNQSFLPEAGVNLDSDTRCFNGSADKHTNPDLGPLQNNGGQTDTMALLDGSPAINAAANNVCPTDDQRGVTRPQPAGGTCDIGAYEATAPFATTNAATAVTGTSATVNGAVNPDNLSTTYHFEYGTTTAYGSSTASQSAGSGYGDVAVSATLSGLKPGTTYHFRVVATNAVGTSVGADQTFTTPGGLPVVITGPATSVGGRSATLTGSVTPNGSTTVKFQYGTSKKYGKTSSSTKVSGSKKVTVRLRVKGLKPGAIYHYRIVASNASGTSRGKDRTFRTKAIIAISGVSARGCMAASRRTVRVRVSSLLGVKTTVKLGGRTIAHGGRSVTLHLSGLKAGTHTLKVTSTGKAGSTTRTIRFAICRAAAPTFTG
jgi:hypothetical protein